MLLLETKIILICCEHECLPVLLLLISDFLLHLSTDQPIHPNESNLLVRHQKGRTLGTVETAALQPRICQ